MKIFAYILKGIAALGLAYGIIGLAFFLLMLITNSPFNFSTEIIGSVMSLVVLLASAVTAMMMGLLKPVIIKRCSLVK